MLKICASNGNTATLILTWYLTAGPAPKLRSMWVLQGCPGHCARQTE